MITIVLYGLIDYNPLQIAGFVNRLATIFDATSAPNDFNFSIIPGRAFCRSLLASATTAFSSLI